MKAICFYWDDSAIINSDGRCQRRLMKLWTHTAKAFGITRLLCICNDFVPELVFDVEVDFTVYPDVEAVRAEFPDFKFVVLTERGQPLDSVTIPEDNVVYMTGSNYSEPITEEGDVLVSFTADIPLWDIVAMSLLLNEVR